MTDATTLSAQTPDAAPVAGAEAVGVEVPVPGAAPGAADGRLGELAEIITAYNRVTEKLQASHETLKAEVLRLRRELASTSAQLQRSKRLSALGEMAAGIAHEVRNPLAAIQLYAQMVEADLAALGPAAAEPLGSTRKIAAAVRGLNGIVCDVLSFAREVNPRPAMLDAEAVLARAAEAHAPAAQAAGVAVRVQADPGGGPAVWADPGLVHQALLNLLRNAVDAVARQPEPDRRVVALSAWADEAGVVLAVRDRGPGIAPADVDRIFNPFFTTRSTGTGLGLAIVHRIVDAHGGAIAVRHDGGAVFEMSLPGPGAGAGERRGQDEGAAA